MLLSTGPTPSSFLENTPIYLSFPPFCPRPEGLTKKPWRLQQEVNFRQTAYVQSFIFSLGSKFFHLQCPCVRDKFHHEDDNYADDFWYHFYYPHTSKVWVVSCMWDFSAIENSCSSNPAILLASYYLVQRKTSKTWHQGIMSIKWWRRRMDIHTWRSLLCRFPLIIRKVRRPGRMQRWVTVQSVRTNLPQSPDGRLHHRLLEECEVEVAANAGQRIIISTD